MIDIVSAQAVNPKKRDKVYRQRTFRAVESWYGSASWARSFFRRMVKEFSGPTYGHQGDEAKIKYLNKLAQFVNAYVMILAGNRPQVDVTTNYRELLWFAKHWGVNINTLFEMIDFKSQQQDWVKNALFLVGIMKVHYADSGHVVFENDIEADPGIIYASSISLEDYVFDMSVTRTGRCQMAGDKYRMKISDMKKGLDLGYFDEEACENIQPTSKMGHDRDRTSLASVGQESDDDEIEPKFDVIDLFDYEDQVIRTYQVTNTRTMTLGGIELGPPVEWDGEQTGPYHMLRFYTVPDNILPKSPLADIEAMDRFINNLARKVSRQAYRQKENMIYTPAGSKSGESLTGSRDGESVMVTDIRDVTTIKQGGVDPSTSQTLGNFLALFDEMSGNLKSLLGLGAQAETLGAEQLIHSAGTRMGNYLEDRVHTELEGVVRNMSKLMWGDDFLEISSSILLDGSGVKPIYADASWKPDLRAGTVAQYMFKVVPHSTRLITPSEKVQTVTQIVQNIYIPLQQHLMAQGMIIDVNALNEFLADNLNRPELRNILTYMSGASGGSQPTPDMAGKPSVSQRNYVRRNVGSQASNSAADNWQATPATQPQSNGAMR